MPPGPRPPLHPADALHIAASASARTAVLVEGWSDQAAVETLARRWPLDLGALGVVVLPMNGATNMRRFAEALLQRPGLALAGLYDAGEQRVVLQALHLASQADAERRGFFACRDDLEDEMIRALGTGAVLQVIEAAGEAVALQRFQAQPQQRGRELHAQQRRFLGIRAGRKIRYGTLLAEALPPDRVPAPLARLMRYLRGDAGDV